MAPSKEATPVNAEAAQAPTPAPAPVPAPEPAQVPVVEKEPVEPAQTETNGKHDLEDKNDDEKGC